MNDNSKSNQFVSPKDRHIPFPIMIYFGDGETDIPCFRLVKDLGGLSVAVFKPNTKGARERAQQLVTDERVHRITLADYREGTELDHLIKAQIDYVAAREALTRQLPPHAAFPCAPFTAAVSCAMLYHAPLLGSPLPDEATRPPCPRRACRLR